MKTIQHYKLITLVLLVLLSVNMAKAQTPPYISVNSFQGTATAGVSGYNISQSITDASGNVYCYGTMIGPFVQFGVLTLNNPGSSSDFLVKFDNAGNVLWARTISVDNPLFNMTIDGVGDILISSAFGGSDVVFQDFTIPSLPGDNIRSFLVKYSGSTGAYLWTKVFGTLDPFPNNAAIESEIILANQMDEFGNIVFIYNTNAPTFSIGNTTINSTLDLFYGVYQGRVVVKLNSQGDVVSVFQLMDEAATRTIPTLVTTDLAGNIYVAGDLGSIFQTDVIYYNFILSGFHSMFIAKFEASGNIIWATSAGANSGVIGGIHVFDIFVNENQNVAITGSVLGTCVFGGATTITATGPNGAADIFTTKYDSAFNFLWAIGSGGNLADIGQKVILDAAGSVYSTADLNGGLSLITKYDQASNIEWIDTLNNGTYITNLTLNENDNIYISGYFSNASATIHTTTLTNNPIYLVNNFVVEIGYNDAIVWTGNNSSSWTSPFNWDPQQVPTVNDNVSIPAGRPFEPIIKSGEVANCKKLTIADGALLRMNAGTLNVYGAITATSAGAFQLNGGGMHLFHGSEFPENMTFNNLTIKNESDVDADNQYKFNGLTSVNGNFKVFGTVTKPVLPEIILEEGDDIHVYKNFTFSSGTIGWPYVNPIPTDRSQLPGLFFAGTGIQNIAISNQSSVQNSSAVDCNIYMANPAAKFTLPNRELSFFNLIVNDNFNLAGKRLTIIGKIIYANGIGSTFKITNSTPSRGSISIFNDALLVYDTDDQYIRMDKMRALRCNLTSPSTNTILQTAFAADTLEVKGYLDLNGQNLTIGSTSTDLGSLDVESLGTSITQGTLFLYGNAVNPPYQLVALALNNLVLNNPNGVVLNNAINIPSTSPNWSQMLLYGTAKLTAGSFDLNGSLISLVKNTNTNSPNVAKIVETPFNTFLNFGGTGAGPGLRIDTNVTTAITNKNYGGLGFNIQSNVPLNQLSIVRSPVEQTGINGGSSIFRTYTIYNQGNTPGMNAIVSIDYDDIELGGVNESDLSIFRRSSDDPAGVWNPVASIVFPSTNTVTSFGTSLTSIDYSTSVGGFTQYTLASTSDPLRNVNQSISNSTKVNVYPNPFTTNLTAQFASEISEQATMQVVDFTGKLIEERSVQLNKGGNNINLCCMDELPAGIYFLKITSSQTNSIVKVVK